MPLSLGPVYDNSYTTFGKSFLIGEPSLRRWHVPTLVWHRELRHYPVGGPDFVRWAGGHPSAPIRHPTPSRSRANRALRPMQLPRGYALIRFCEGSSRPTHAVRPSGTGPFLRGWLLGMANRLLAMRACLSLRVSSSSREFLPRHCLFASTGVLGPESGMFPGRLLLRLRNIRTRARPQARYT